MNKQEIQECLPAFEALRSAVSSFQETCINERRSTDQFILSCSVRNYLGALIFCLHRNLLGSGNEDQIHNLCVMLDEAIGLLANQES